MKNSNLLWAVVISMVFVVLWDTVVISRFRPKTPPPAAVTAQKPAAIEKPAAPAAKQAPLETPAPQTGPKEITLKASGVQVVVSNKGAAAVKWHIQEEDGNWVELVKDPVLETYPEIFASLKQTSDRSAVLSFDHLDGFRVSKTLTLLDEPPFHSVTVSVTNTGKATREVQIPMRWSRGLHKHIVESDPKNRNEDATRAEMRIAAYQGRMQSWRSGFIMNRQIETDFTGPFEWVGTDNHHFLAALMQKDGAIPSIHVSADRDNAPSYHVPVSFSLAPGETKTQAYRLYVGPKKHSALQALGHNLDAAVDFGTFGIISKSLLWTLEFFRSHTNNYGWAIVLLTILIQILVFPLTKKSLMHSVRMKDLQPHIKHLQDQYKSDPKRMQIEMLNLYRKNGMKFMGMEGCFPILLQLPIFFAFYTTLNVAYELRGAAWLWIPDLGIHDPYYILPVLMGVGMFVQQKTTTVSADPAQARMMMFMPVIMTFMFLKLPAGLVLYWSVNSVCTILIQKILQWRKHAAPKIA